MLREHKFLFLATLFSCFISALLLIFKVYVSLSYIPDISGSETSAIFPIQRLCAGLPIYTNPEKSPFLVTQYTPIYFVFVSSVIKLVDLPTFEVHKIFIASRLISITLTLLSVFVAWVIIYQHTRRNKLIASLGASLIYQILSFWFLTSSRPDSLLVLCTSLFVYAVFKAIDHESQENNWWYVALFVAVTAFFVKQSGAIHSISLGLFFAIQGRWKFLAWLVCSGIIFFALYLVILPVTSVNIFFLNIVGGVANSTSWDWFYDWTLQKLLFQFAPLLAINFVVVFLSLQSKKNEKSYLLAICSICFFLFSMLTAFKIGAGVGYFQDYLIVAVIMLVLFFYGNFCKISTGINFATHVGCLYLCLVALHCFLFVFSSYTNSSLENFKRQYIEQRDIAAFLKVEKKLKDTDRVYVCGTQHFTSYYLKHFLYKNILIPFSDIIFLADRNKTFDFNEFRTLVRNKEIKYVISGRNEEPQTILGQKFYDLRKIHSTGNLDVYIGF